MADIELVIKIPEETYKDIQSHDWKNVGRWYSEEWKSIHNGTPLPKCHGRIGDLDAVMSDINNSIDKMTDIGIIVDGQWLWEKLNDAIYNAKPIIESDKESEDS